jgi:hypothetical protein
MCVCVRARVHTHTCTQAYTNTRTHTHILIDVAPVLFYTNVKGPNKHMLVLACCRQSWQLTAVTDGRTDKVMMAKEKHEAATATEEDSIRGRQTSERRHGRPRFYVNYTRPRPRDGAFPPHEISIGGRRGIARVDITENLLRLGRPARRRRRWHISDQSIAG